MSIPRFSSLISAKKVQTKNQETSDEKTPSNSTTANSIATMSSTSLHPYEVQMFCQSPRQQFEAKYGKPTDSIGSGAVSDLLKRNEYVIPKGWTDEQLLGTNSNWQTFK